MTYYAYFTFYVELKYGKWDFGQHSYSSVVKLIIAEKCKQGYFNSLKLMVSFTQLGFVSGWKDTFL